MVVAHQFAERFALAWFWLISRIAQRGEYDRLNIIRQTQEFGRSGRTESTNIACPKTKRCGSQNDVVHDDARIDLIIIALIIAAHPALVFNDA